MDCRRQNQRTPAQITAECIVDADRRQHACLITDAGHDGLGVLCSAQTTVHTGSRVLLRIYLPCGPILVRGRIVWVRMLTRRRCLWAAGIAVALIERAQRELLLEYARSKNNRADHKEAL
jgi:hypothetical protein